MTRERNLQRIPRAVFRFVLTGPAQDKTGVRVGGVHHEERGHAAPAVVVEEILCSCLHAEVHVFGMMLRAVSLHDVRHLIKHFGQPPVSKLIVILGGFFFLFRDRLMKRFRMCFPIIEAPDLGRIQIPVNKVEGIGNRKLQPFCHQAVLRFQIAVPRAAIQDNRNQKQHKDKERHEKDRDLKKKLSILFGTGFRSGICFVRHDGFSTPDCTL